MEINQALNIAKRLKHHFSAFEKIDAFIKEAASLQAVMKDFESRKAAIQEEIATLEEQKAEMSKAIEELEPIVQEKEKTQRDLDGLRDEIASIKAKLSG